MPSPTPATGTPTAPAPASPRAAVLVGEDGVARCAWAGTDAEYLRYHDEEWGVPLHTDRKVFEKISLEGFQAGLSWITILRRRPAFRLAFADFDIDAVAAFGPDDIERLVGDAGIIRHRGKIQAVIDNARLTQQLIAESGDGALDRLLWSFEPPEKLPRPRSFADFVATTPESTALSTELRRLGYKFVGPTTMYALMQSAGLVDDHVTGCFRASP
ncbi:DNA-3-methyladenine glycosylase I [Subtercola boreus]|uniref:3-methyladenine DNA glycosylase n=1 Tax=Subtercola boreus TaxID=120213 RepID=A0A3E0WCK0_9MICO|nr:DNA-3-methyladenine glycosylase I [Subtercola boreus]RFA20270.1 3-methyladenine DNA glycosylase [Subtercola boreus]RFA20422.1 3-methyladenine DNA glycosylase [Subtercola boreus]RFA26674.1 3-methyladenine DNA glycosylase [Subtercola boreus]